LNGEKAKECIIIISATTKTKWFLQQPGHSKLAADQWWHYKRPSQSIYSINIPFQQEREHEDVEGKKEFIFLREITTTTTNHQ
jgi:hypothetical protein